MSHLSPYEHPRIPRLPVHGANASTVRSKSAPGSRNEISRGLTGDHLVVPKEQHDSSSQMTVTDTSDVIKPVQDNPDLEPGDQSKVNARIDSDPSSSSSRRRAHLDGWNERVAVVPRSNLTVLDVAALILNKMVGTGIFTTPGAVLASTRSKPMSVALWGVGGVWTALFLLVYLEFGNALPFNGGELVYLDEIYRKPELLSTILFSAFFIVVANSYGNSVQFAKHVLIAADPTVDVIQELDSRLVKYIAISVVTVGCLIHYHSSRAGLFLNKLVAWYKVLLLFVVFVAGLAYSKREGSKWGDSPKDASSADGLTGMVLVFYAYQGWENANYVAGEIRALEGRTPKRTLNIGAFLGVITVSVLYVLVAPRDNMDLSAVLHFAPKVFNNTTGLKVCVAISAFGNILAVTYTSAKVKQTIAVQRILPFWRYLQMDKDTPKGALVLHWITSVIFISVAPTSSDGYTFATALFTYGHAIFCVFVALGLWGLRSRMREHAPTYRLTIFRGKWILYIVPIIFALGNLLVLGFSAKEKKPGRIPRYWWPVTFFLVIIGGFLYWSAFQITQFKVSRGGRERTIGEMIGFEVFVYNQGTEGIPVKVKDSIAETLAAKIDGSKRRVQVKTSGRLAACGNGVRRAKDLLGRYLF